MSISSKNKDTGPSELRAQVLKVALQDPYPHTKKKGYRSRELKVALQGLYPYLLCCHATSMAPYLSEPMIFSIASTGFRPMHCIT